MGKAAFPKELLNDDIEGNNEKWLNEFQKSELCVDGYYQSLKNFFRFKSYYNKSFNLFTTNDVWQYIEVMIDNDFSGSRIKGMGSMLSTLRNFLKDKYPKDFNENWLKDLTDIRLGEIDKKYSESMPLNLIQLEMVKEYIKENIRTKYIFQVFFQLGIQKKDLKTCQPKNADKEGMAFRESDKVIEYNDSIQELLFRVEKYDKFKATYDMITRHLKKIEKYLKRNGLYDKNKAFTYFDIIKTHEMFFVICPNCGRKFESISTNWVLSKTKFSSNYYLVCSKCKGAQLNDFNSRT